MDALVELVRKDSAERWERVVTLAETFPTLKVRPHQTVAELATIASNENEGRHVREAARFVLLVWDGSIGQNWRGLAFNLRDAWGSWDPTHRAAWQRWAADPWFA